MPSTDVRGRFNAVLSADVKVYSWFTGDDRAAAVRTLTSYQEVMVSLIRQYRSRLVDSCENSVLAEFLTVVDAVQCALEIQKEVKAINSELPKNRNMEFGIGIGLRELIGDEERICRDEFEIAKYIARLADAGGIYISGGVYARIKSKFLLRYEYVGEHTFRSATKAIRVYQIQTEQSDGSGSIRRRDEGRTETPPHGGNCHGNPGSCSPSVACCSGMELLFASF
jgi:class 3 adenylate cyclase